MEINSTTHLSISCRILSMSFANLNFFPNGMSEIIISTLSDGSGKSEIQESENPIIIIVKLNIYNLNYEKMEAYWIFFAC